MRSGTELGQFLRIFLPTFTNVHYSLKISLEAVDKCLSDMHEYIIKVSLSSFCS